MTVSVLWLFLTVPEVGLQCVTVVFPGLEAIKMLCSTQLSTKFILLINVKMPTIVGILTFICRINASYESLKQIIPIFFSVLEFMSS